MTFDANTLYKVLDEGRSCNGGSGKWTPNRWRSVRGKVVACERGIHYCKGAQVLSWLGPELWLFEDGSEDHDDREDRCVTRRGRVTERIETWNERTARLFAVDCARVAVNRYAREVLPLLHACLDVTTAAADDDAAWSAARSAARSAAAYAAGFAAWSAARSAAESAARSAAGSAARFAAWSAAASAQYALLCRYLSGEEGPFVEEEP